MQITEFELHDLLKELPKLTKEERKRLKSLLLSSDEEEEKSEAKPLAKKKRRSHVKKEELDASRTPDAPSSSSSLGKLRFV